MKRSRLARRTSLRRMPLARITARQRRRMVTLDRLRPYVFERDHYSCKVTIPHDCTGRAEHAHHILPRGHGGKDTLSNLVSVCFLGHLWIHGNPKEAQELGLLRSAK